MDVPGNNEPIDYFFLLFDQNVLSMIVEQTNSYAIDVFCERGKTEKSRISQWKDLTISELLRFIGLILNTGTIRLSRYQDYWKKDRLFGLTCFSEQMSRDRFLIILRCIHFAKNVAKSDPQSEDRLYKIRPLIDYFNNKMREVYYPGKQLSLDESMMLWRGRLVFRQYIKNKRHPYGIKLYMLTEPNGIVLKFLVYTGQLDDMGGKGHTTKVVLHLLQDYLRNGHSVFMHNFYNSFELSKRLLEQDSYCTGTLRQDRTDNPKEIKTMKLKKGETVARYSDGAMIAKWKDKRDVTYISTEFENNMVSVSNKRGIEKIKPLPIVEYNQYMSGIDRQDQMMAYYPSEHKTLRWYKKLVIHIIQMGLMNSFHLYNKYSGKKLNLYDLRLLVIKALLLEKEVPRYVPKPGKQSTEHFPSKIIKKNSTGRIVRKRCI
ncbi:unnamed protein product [Acanthoscelides obtectus]|uniref:PiggyBac transposable element-derived protein domain-containing protein n=1 Tax=Acanthoscelides obtectus TaxID=200917 RepID=A0A9P0Q7C8_ACAOB|nr:unnamed protein product [Acanthoscelides obtectus]CAK1680498.1 PiggyBac transposable element-derived protein 4 [Acanthoscelides obtectus]